MDLSLKGKVAMITGAVTGLANRRRTHWPGGL
ncbi:MAG: hypothetical protein Ct9H300mP11_11170 [Chloroflexota bacterium]|nr:MAG: hypothetical protein Ct9H300mP11_11170 [Chloroflexota bacterium]